MFFVIRGIRNALIKTHQVHKECKSCRNFDLTVYVYQDYFHFYYLPILPSGVKSSRIQCNRCGAYMGSAAISNEYEETTRKPFYLYLGLIFFVGVALLVVGASLKEFMYRDKYIAAPKFADVYFVDQDINGTEGYYFLRVMEVNGDSVVVYPSHLIYNSSSVPGLAANDYFDASQPTTYAIGALKQLFKKGTIESVFRDYDSNTGFNRVK